MDHYHVYKVETIGDSYMVASGVPVVFPEHAVELAKLAIELRDSVEEFIIPHLHEALHLRIGIHSGNIKIYLSNDNDGLPIVWSIGCRTSWLIDEIIHWSNDWQVKLFTGWLIFKIIHWSIDWLVKWFSGRLIGQNDKWLIGPTGRMIDWSNDC